jgi:glutathione S-transferase
MRALLRYRQIPFRWVLRGSPDDADTPEVPVSLIPVLVHPGRDGAPDEATIDSTPQIRRLEAEYAGRSVLPADPALALLDALIEDYADEWLTKAMFHYRWSYEPDIQKSSYVLPLARRLELAGETLEAAARMIADRQIARLAVVGSNEITGPVIEASYRRLLQLLSEHLIVQPFLLGQRPGAGDFGLYGQLVQLATFDPTSAALAAAEAPRVVAWIDRADDLSWLQVDGDEGWLPRDALPPTLRALLGEVGRVYAPFLLANAEALEGGANQVECEIDGRKWVQQPFPYQGKCLRWLREGHAALTDDDRAFIDGVLEGTGCEELFSAQG